MLVLKKLLKYLVLFKVISQVLSEVSMADMRRFASCKKFNFMKIKKEFRKKEKVITSLKMLKLFVGIVKLMILA